MTRLFEYALNELHEKWKAELEYANHNDCWDHGGTEEGREWCAKTLKKFLSVADVNNGPLVDLADSWEKSLNDEELEEIGWGFYFGVKKCIKEFEALQNS